MYDSANQAGLSPPARHETIRAMTRNEKIGVGTGAAALLALAWWLRKKPEEKKEGGGGGAGDGQVAPGYPLGFPGLPLTMPPGYGYPPPGSYVSPPLAPLPADPIKTMPTLTPTATPSANTAPGGLTQAMPGIVRASAPAPAPAISLNLAPPAAFAANRPVIRGANLDRFSGPAGSQLSNNPHARLR